MSNHTAGTEPQEKTVRWHCPERQRASELRVCYERDELAMRVAHGEGFRFTLDTPKKLKPVTIAKPWGEERWYTGMEARGQSRVIGEAGELPLAAYLALAPEQISSTPVVLLKLLVSLPEPQRGELYCEVHREKAEAYLVTGLDPSAWPEGHAELRYGIAPATRERYADDNQLRVALTAAAAALEANPNDQTRRADFNAFIDRVPLKVGSRFQIARGVPHGLPHGVRVIEFQTPSYERLILAASQPVVTQPAWDSAAAAATLRLSAPDPEPAPDPSLPKGQQRLARFSDFGARVVSLKAATQPHLLPLSRGAAVVCCTQGSLNLGTLTLDAEEAAVVPQAALDGGAALTLAGGEEATAVIAAADY